jgi:hypothetical protein
VEPALQSFLLDDSALTTLIGTRVWPIILPQKPVLPAVTYSEISAIRGHTMQGPDGLAFARMQIDSWAKSFKQARILADAVRARLDGFRGDFTDSPPTTFAQGIFFETERSMYESEPELFRVSSDYTVVFAE